MSCDCPKTCPACGHDLVALKDLHLGSLSIVDGWIILWHGARVPLSQNESLIVIALARAGGKKVSQVALCEVIGYDGDAPRLLIASTISHIRRRFRRIDPHFDQIGTGLGANAGGNVWWVIDDLVVTALRKTSPRRRRIHRHMLLNPRRTLRELGADLHMTHTGVRKHLTLLERDGLVERRDRCYRHNWVAVGTIEAHRALEA